MQIYKRQTFYTEEEAKKFRRKVKGTIKYTQVLTEDGVKMAYVVFYIP